MSPRLCLIPQAPPSFPIFECPAPPISRELIVHAGAGVEMPTYESILNAEAVTIRPKRRSPS